MRVRMDCWGPNCMRFVYINCKTPNPTIIEVKDGLKRHKGWTTGYGTRPYCPEHNSYRW